MADKNVKKNIIAERRRRRVRGKVSGTAECPRLTVRKSLRNVFVQIVDDRKHITLVGLASNSRAVIEISDKQVPELDELDSELFADDINQKYETRVTSGVFSSLREDADVVDNRADFY